MGNHDHHGEVDHEEGSVQDEDELDDEFDDYATVTNRGMITTVPAKEPVYNAVPLKSALKKPKGSVKTSMTVSMASTASANKVTMINEDSDDDEGPILYRDDHEQDQDEDQRLATKIARKDSLALKLSQRPPRQELIERNILHGVSDDERKID